MIPLNGGGSGWHGDGRSTSGCREQGGRRGGRGVGQAGRGQGGGWGGRSLGGVVGLGVALDVVDSMVE